MKNEENIFFNFYTTPRLSINLTDEGGPFGLDIHTALEICYLINFYKCDSILETGTNTGDTTEFLAKTFPHLPIETCEIEKDLSWEPKFDLINGLIDSYKNDYLLSNHKEVDFSSDELLFD